MNYEESINKTIEELETNMYVHTVHCTSYLENDRFWRDVIQPTENCAIF